MKLVSFLRYSKPSDMQNIIEILDHGWIKSYFNFYYIDMELCDLSLRDYIDYHQLKKESFFDANTMQATTPVFTQRHRTVLEKFQNMWMIGLHIARGLEFMHAHKQVHRDLNPRNGMPLWIFYLFIQSSIVIERIYGN